jgi:hypothetical protein
MVARIEMPSGAGVLTTQRFESTLRLLSMGHLQNADATRSATLWIGWSGDLRSEIGDKKGARRNRS